jgi:3-phosphoshikimate 1-carboxyvinyltransferase
MGAERARRGAWRAPAADPQGPAGDVPIVYETPAASAQIKSAVLLAGLNSPGRTTVIEREATATTPSACCAISAARFGRAARRHRRRITVQGQPILRGTEVGGPGRPSSAAFPLVAALVAPGSEVVLEGVMTNPLRSGLLTTLMEMGADIERVNERDEGGEMVADLRVRAGRLTGVDVPAARAPSMIDEYPILAVAAAVAHGPTRMRGLQELRVKESDRLAAVAAGLAAAGVRHAIEGDDLVVHGCGGPAPGGGTVATHLDHRIAMAFLVLGLGRAETVAIDDGAMIATSFRISSR